MHHLRCIQCHLITNALWKSLSQFGHTCFHSFRHIERIGTRKLIDGNTCRRTSFQTGHHIVFLTSQLDTCHIFQTKNPSTILYPKDDFTELIRCSQASLNIQGILKSIVSCPSKRLSHITGRDLHILCLNGSIDLLGTETTDTHRLGIQPDTHGIVTGSHHVYRSYPRHTSQLVHQVQIGIVGQVKSIINTIANQSKHHDNVRRFLLYRYPLLFHRFGQRIQRYTHTVLHHDCSHINVCSNLESNGQGIHTRCRRSGTHIHHPFYPIHLLFNGDTYGLRHRFGIRSRIDGIHLYRRRCNVRILGHRKFIEHDKPCHHDKQSQNRSENRTFYKEFRKHKRMVFIIYLSVKPSFPDALSSRPW